MKMNIVVFLILTSILVACSNQTPDKSNRGEISKFYKDDNANEQKKPLPPTDGVDPNLPESKITWDTTQPLDGDQVMIVPMD